MIGHVYRKKVLLILYTILYVQLDTCFFIIYNYLHLNKRLRFYNIDKYYWLIKKDETEVSSD